jgi:hypothetical protein
MDHPPLSLYLNTQSGWFNLNLELNKIIADAEPFATGPLLLYPDTQLNFSANGKKKTFILHKLWAKLDSNKGILLKSIAMILSAQVSQTRTIRHWASFSHQ